MIREKDKLMIEIDGLQDLHFDLFGDFYKFSDAEDVVELEEKKEILIDVIVKANRKD